MQIARTIALAGLFTAMTSTAAHAQWPSGNAPIWPTMTPSNLAINPATGLPLISDPFAGVRRFRPFTPYNPVIAQTNAKVTNVQYDIWGRPILTTERNQMKQSALDPDRNVIDPGSLRRVNYYEYDNYGQRVQVTGTRWTSYGKPHSNLKRTTVSQSGNGITVVNEMSEVARPSSPSTGGNGRP